MPLNIRHIQWYGALGKTSHSNAFDVLKCYQFRFKTAPQRREFLHDVILTVF